MHIETQHADDVDFSKYKTWNWLPPATRETDPRLADPLVVARIRGAIENQLVAQGFRKDPTSPDSMYDRYDQNWTYQYTSEWQQGTLLIDILDAQTKELVWRGSAQAELTMNASDEEKDKRVDEAVRKMLKDFPPN
jgi:hypothetical protein